MQLMTQLRDTTGQQITLQPQVIVHITGSNHTLDTKDQLCPPAWGTHPFQIALTHPTRQELLQLQRFDLTWKRVRDAAA